MKIVRVYGAAGERQEAISYLTDVCKMLKESDVLGYESIIARGTAVTLQYDFEDTYYSYYSGSHRNSSSISTEVYNNSEYNDYLNDQVRILETLPCVDHVERPGDSGRNWNFNIKVYPVVPVDDSPLPDIEIRVEKPDVMSEGYFVEYVQSRGQGRAATQQEYLGEFNDDFNACLEVLSIVDSTISPSNFSSIDELLDYFDEQQGATTIKDVYKKTADGKKVLVYKKPAGWQFF